MILRVKTYSDREAWVATVLSAECLPLGCKVTAVALAAHLNFETGQLNPAASRLAERTAQTRRAVHKHLALLQRHGWLDWQSTKGRLSNRYDLLLRASNAVPVFTVKGSNPEPPCTVASAELCTVVHGCDEPTLNDGSGYPKANGAPPFSTTVNGGALQPCPGVHTNLEENPESNLGDLQRRLS